MAETSQYEQLNGNTSLYQRWAYGFSKLEKYLIVLSFILGVVVFSLSIALANSNSKVNPPANVSTTETPITTTPKSNGTTTIITTIAPKSTTTITTPKSTTTTITPTPSTTAAPITTTPSTTAAPLTTTSATTPGSRRAAGITTIALHPNSSAATSFDAIDSSTANQRAGL